MNPWPFVAAAYTVTWLAVAGLILWARFSMRRSESAADELRRK